MTQAQFLVLEVVVEVKAFAGFQNHVDVFGLAVTAHGVGEAVFQRAEDGDQAGGDAVLAGDLPGEGFFADLAAGQIAKGASGLFGTGVGSGFDARGQPLGENAEVFEEDAAGIEIGFHDRGLEEMPECATQAQSVKARQNTCNRVAKSVKKGRRNAGDGGRSLLVHHPNSYPNARCSAILVAALPRCVSALILLCLPASQASPESRCFSRIAWLLGRGRPPTRLAMGQNRQKTGKTCLLTPSTSSGRMEPE